MMEDRMFWWIEGYRKKQWWPLYCAENEQVGRALLRRILAAEEKTAEDKHEATEQKVLSRYKDFRLRPPYLSEMSKAQRKRVKAQAKVEGSDRPMCARCGWNTPGKVKKDGIRYWKCPKCGLRWPRKAPGRPSKAR
jgi:ribosomal protein L37AE/L43A